MLAGRDFDTHDIAGAGGDDQRAGADRFFRQDRSANRLVEWSGGPLQVVGVAADENTDSLDTGIRPVVYFPNCRGGPVVNIVVRAGGRPRR